MGVQQDRFSNLPDSIIHHILSCLPSTKQAIQTGILSKRWHKQWTHVPVLIFDFTRFSKRKAISSSHISKIIEDTLSLHDCSKINNFCLQLLSVISYVKGLYVFPDFLFNNASLLKLTTHGCFFMPTRNVNWACLTELFMRSCTVRDQEVLNHILSRIPLLKSLKLSNVHFEFNDLVVSSKSLKTFVLQLPSFQSDEIFGIDLEISCPNLEELSVDGILIQGACCSVLDRGIRNVLSNCLLLESLEIMDYRGFENLVIASKSLKRLVLSYLYSCLAIEIACPNLEELKLTGCLNVRTAKLMSLPSPLIYATVDFYHANDELWFYDCFGYDESPEIQRSLIKDILQQLKDVLQLKIGSWFMEALSAIEVGALFPLELNIKCLILDYPSSNDYYSGFFSLLGSSNMLEKLVIDFTCSQYGLNDVAKDYWRSDSIAFDCLGSHLKIVKIIGFLKRNKCKIINFVRFLLKNARVLEKLVILLKDAGTSIPFEVSEELLNLPRCSQKAIVELLISK